jgi:hypothetical protein
VSFYRIVRALTPPISPTCKRPCGHTRVVLDQVWAPLQDGPASDSAWAAGRLGDGLFRIGSPSAPSEVAASQSAIGQLQDVVRRAGQACWRAASRCRQ